MKNEMVRGKRKWIQRATARQGWRGKIRVKEREKGRQVESITHKNERRNKIKTYIKRERETWTNSTEWHVGKLLSYYSIHPHSSFMPLPSHFPSSPPLPYLYLSPSTLSFPFLSLFPTHSLTYSFPSTTHILYSRIHPPTTITTKSPSHSRASYFSQYSSISNSNIFLLPLTSPFQ